MARIALIIGALAAILYPIPLQLQGTTYYQTVGFLVLLTAMLGVGWNVIGGWAGQFDFGPQVFFAVGAYTSALLYVKLGVDAWLGLPVAAAAAALICAVLTYPLTRLRGHYFAISTVAIWMIAQPIGATWDYIGAAQGLQHGYRRPRQRHPRALADKGADGESGGNKVNDADQAGGAEQAGRGE